MNNYNVGDSVESKRVRGAKGKVTEVYPNGITILWDGMQDATFYVNEELSNEIN